MDNQSLQDAVVCLTSALVKCASVSPHDNGAQDILRQFLEPLGFHFHSFDIDRGAKALWCEYGNAGPLIVFAGHTDVVPVGDERAWKYPPFSATIADDKIWGRGTADMKGGVAAFCVAIKEYLSSPNNSQPSFRIGVLITSDEETDAKGTKAVLDYLIARGDVVDECIVAEPAATILAGDVIKVGRRGSLTARISIQGTQGHSAYPELAENPIHNALPILTQIHQLSWDSGDELWPATSLQITHLMSGTGATNVIPGACEFAFNIRFSPKHSREEIISRIEEILTLSNARYSIRWSEGSRPFLTSPGKLVTRLENAIEKVVGTKPKRSTSGGTSDARFLSAAGFEVVECGVSSATVHQVDEHITLEDLVRLTHIFVNYLKNHKT